ncbi:MAG: NADH-quinone oxidoreductase subunit J [Acidimicrobiia bacterium]|nr:NADH-quinone oxidoreductase subunit J [Acidimicrobiia bacterium]
MVELVLFFLLGAAAVAGAVTVIFARNTIHAAMGLLGTLFSLGVIYVVNLAHLVAAVQVIVYAGAVMTLFLFVIMLIGVDKTEDTSESLPFQRKLVGGLALIILLLGGGLAFGGRFSWTPAATPGGPIPNGTVQAVAERLFTGWVLAFEVTALLLTIAAAGAIALAQFKRREEGQ